MPADLFPGLAARLGVRRRAESDEFELEQRAALKREAERDMRHGRPTILGEFSRAPKPRLRRRFDSGLIAKLLSGLALGKLIGLDIGDSAFADLYAGFATTLQELGLTVTPPAPSPNSAVRAALVARGMGVTSATADAIQPATPRSRLKFDAFAAEMPADPTTLQAALDAGSIDGLPLGITEAISALIGAVRDASLANDGNALRLIGEDFGALSAALQAATSGATTSTATTATATTAVERGYTIRRKGAVHIGTGIWVDYSEVEPGPDGEPRLKPGCGSPELRKRLKAAGIKV